MRKWRRWSIGVMRRSEWPRRRERLAAARRRRPGGVLFRGQQPLESRVALERREVRIDAQPGGGEIVRRLEQRLELVHRLVRITGDVVHADALMVDVRAPRVV